MDDALAVSDVLVDDGAEAVLAAGGALVADDVAVAPTGGGVAVTDGVAPEAPSWEHVEAQTNRHHVRSQAPKREHYPVPPGFPGHMGLRLPEEFPKPLAPGRLAVVVPRLAASMVTTTPPGLSHSHQPGVLEIEGEHVPSPHQTNGFGA